MDDKQQNEQRKAEARQLPNKRRCAYTGRGTHYFIVEPGDTRPFCSDKCQRRDDREGPNR
jgi:hypothetical protein